MVDSTMDYDNPHSMGGRDPSLGTALQALKALVSSAEPAVVFSSLVRLCAPAICESATATISGPDEKVHAVSWPRDAVDHHHQPRRFNVVTPFESAATGDYPAYRGVVSLRFEGHDPASPILAQLLVERALATVERQRLADSVARQRTVVENLEVALTSNREISVAVGILMATHSLGADGAFHLLRHVSQHTNTKLRAIAVEVVRSGRLDVPTGLLLSQQVVQKSNETNGAFRA